MDRPPFPLPWTAHHNESAYWVESADGRRFAFCYFSARTWTGSGTESHLTEDEARRLVANFVKLPGLLKRGP